MMIRRIKKQMRVDLFCIFLTLFVFIECKTKVRELKHLFGGENAVWSESIYMRGQRPSTGEKLTELHVIEYVNTLRKNRIKYAYLFAGPYGVDGRLPEYAFSETAIYSVNLMKELYPGIVILPWVGGLQNKTVYLGDSLWVKNALEDTQKLIRVLDIPGVHVDFEFILSGDRYLDKTINPERPGERIMYGHHVNEFHRMLRELLPDAFISSVVVATSPDTKPWKRKTTLEELNELVQYIDQLSFLYYDTHINDQQVFEDNCLKLIQDIQTLKKNRDIQYLVAIGTFLNVPELQGYRNLEIENIPNSLETIKKSIVQIDTTRQLVDGIAIYSEWTTDKTEWQQFYKHWMN